MTWVIVRKTVKLTCD